MSVRTVWTVVDKDTYDGVYVLRCSQCGKFHRDLYEHWFFTGLYCVGCIQDLLYANVRTLAEVAK